MAHYFWGKEIPDSLEETVEPSGTAVVAVDLQNDFTHPDGFSGSRGDISRAAAVMGPNQRLLGAAREAGILVCYTQQVRRLDGSLDTAGFLAKITESLGGAEPRMCIEGTWGMEIDETVAVTPQDVVVQKHRRSGFAGTNLDTILRGKNVRTVVITGLALSGCVEATVRDAIELGYFVVVPRDCVADYGEERHVEGLKAFERILIKGNLTSSDTLVGLWEGVQPPSQAADRAERASSG